MKMIYIFTSFLLFFAQPQNLLLTGPFPNCDIKLCDFGIARHIARGADVREILGTPDYVGQLIFIFSIFDPYFTFFKQLRLIKELINK